MGALLMAIDTVLQQAENMVIKRYGNKHSIGGMFFNAIVCLFSMIFFFLTDKGGLCFPKELIIYGSISSLMFASGFYSMFLALQYGSYVASVMVASFSGVIAIGYGILFLHEQAGFFTYLAIVLVFASMCLMNYSKKNVEQEKKGVSLKWLIAILVTAVSNGLIAVLSRMQQLRFDQAYDNEFMIISFGGSFILLTLLGFILQRDRLGYIVKHGTIYGLFVGLFNGSKNLVNLFLYLYIPISVITPFRAGLGIISSFLLSVFLYKEKFTKLQLASVALGAVALVLFAL